MLYEKLKHEIAIILKSGQLKAGKLESVNSGKALFELLNKYHQQILAEDETILSYAWKLLRQQCEQKDIFTKVFNELLNTVKVSLPQLSSTTEIELYKQSLACEQNK